MIAQIKYSISVLALLTAAAAGLSAQNAPSPYQGQSHPPADDVIVTTNP